MHTFFASRPHALPPPSHRPPTYWPPTQPHPYTQPPPPCTPPDSRPPYTASRPRPRATPAWHAESTRGSCREHMNGKTPLHPCSHGIMTAHMPPRDTLACLHMSQDLSPIDCMAVYANVPGWVHFALCTSQPTLKPEPRHEISRFLLACLDPGSRRKSR